MDKKYEVFRMKQSTYVQNGDHVFVKRFGDDNFRRGVIEDRNGDSWSDSGMYVRLDSGSLLFVNKTDCFFDCKTMHKMIKEDSRPLDDVISDKSSFSDPEAGKNIPIKGDNGRDDL